MAKSFGAVPAVDGVSLDIRDGEFLCLLGPSGCGKSTLLRLLAGFEAPDRGRIWLDGRDIAADPPHRRPVNMMFQSYALFPHMSVGQNVAYGLRWSGLPRAAIRDRVAEMLRLVRLDGLDARYPAQISGGQRQRVALARALARAPRVLLLDEPMAALDRRLREETQAELKALQARLGTTFVVVTHDQSEAMILADRIAVMERGRVLQADTPRQVYARPNNRFVAGFMGEVNLIEGIVAGRAPGVVRVATPLSAAPLEIASGEPGAWRPGQAVAIGVRPERMRMAAPDGPAPAPNRLDGRWLSSDFVSGFAHHRVQVGPERVLRVTTFGDDIRPDRHGGAVRLTFEPDAAILVD